VSAHSNRKKQEANHIPIATCINSCIDYDYKHIIIETTIQILSPLNILKVSLELLLSSNSGEPLNLRIGKLLENRHFDCPVRHISATVSDDGSELLFKYMVVEWLPTTIDMKHEK
jgi:hypothetical protein